ncbi:hypothetical protein ACE193_20615 [Bernardetia sp. OM2101]|uniref:hypothetical protein n=1 Tax=Bernardetia sp. OM2101 TaxID=3344876 RepID=UPI0035CFC507
MKIVKSVFIFFTCSFLLFFCSVSSFAQLDKNSCEEILGSLEISDFRQISIITHILTTDSSVQKPAVCLLSPFLGFIFKESYVIIENKRNKTTLYLPYNRIKFITTLEPTGIFSGGKTIEIHLME